jgi:hypothetical protein
MNEAKCFACLPTQTLKALRLTLTANLAETKPTEIPGLVYWISAPQQTGFSDGDKIPALTDFSGNGVQSTQSDEAMQCEYRADGGNGRPGIWMDGPVVGYETDLTVTGDYTLFMVCWGTTSNERKRIVQSSGVNWLVSPYRSPGEPARHCFYAEGWVSGGNVAGAPVIDQEVVLLRAVSDTSGPSSHFFVNGQDYTTDPTPVVDPGQIMLGGVGSFTEPTRAMLFELLIYDRLLSVDEINTVEGWLSTLHEIGG